MSATAWHIGWPPVTSTTTATCSSTQQPRKQPGQKAALDSSPLFPVSRSGSMARIDLMCIVVMVLSMGSSAQARQLKAGNFFLPTLAPAASAGSSSGGDTTISIAGAGAGPAFKANAQPPRAAPKTSDLVKAVAGGAWQVTANTITFNPLSNMRVLSPLCPSGQEATSCAGFSGNTAVVLSSVMPAVGSSTNVKTTQCFCDFRNTLGVVLPANGGEVYRCVAYCQ